MEGVDGVGAQGGKLSKGVGSELVVGDVGARTVRRGAYGPSGRRGCACHHDLMGAPSEFRGTTPVVRVPSH